MTMNRIQNLLLAKLVLMIVGIVVQTFRSHALQK